MDNDVKTDILRMCRTCMKEITDASFLYLDCAPAVNTHLTIRQKLYNCIPELDLSITSNAVLCNKCIDNLLSTYEFKKNCLQSEIKIHKYLQQIQHTGGLNLVEVVQFHQPDIKNLDIKIKKEDPEIMEEFKNEDLVCDTSVFNAVSECTDSTGPKYLLKLEKVEMEDELFNAFDDHNINYNSSSAEENSDTHNSNNALNCLSEVIEHQDNYSKNLNKTNVYYQCYRCGHKTESKLKLISHLNCHMQKKIDHGEITSKRLSRYHKNIFCYYRCSLCNYLTKYKCLFDFHNRMHLIKKDYKHIFKHTDVPTKTFYTTIKINKTDIKGNKRKCVKNCNNYNKHSFKNQNKSTEFKQHFSHRNSIKPNMKTSIVEKPFKCSICEYQCNRKGNLKRHIRSHRGEKLFSCYVCKYQCKWKHNLKQHMRIHTRGKPLSCSICKYQCSYKSKLKEHMQIHTGEKPFSCSVCGYQCRQKSGLKAHIRIHTGEKPFSCSVCEFQFGWKSHLQRHMQIHTGEKPFSCSACEYQCSRRQDLKRHILTHTGEKPFSCSVCEYQCRRLQYLKRHMQIHTGEKLREKPREKSFSCSVCEYQCNHKKYLKTHIMRIHTGEKPFSCSVCEYQCRRKQDLKAHIRIHTGEKPFSCSVCEYQCGWKSHLQEHMLIHTGEKPFPCSLCEHQFGRKRELKRHILTHTGEKPFSCSVCEYKCRGKEELKRHMRIHTGEKPFSCSVCEYQCRQKNQLKRHLPIHTGATISRENSVKDNIV